MEEDKEYKEATAIVKGNSLFEGIPDSNGYIGQIFGCKNVEIDFLKNYAYLGHKYNGIPCNVRKFEPGAFYGTNLTKIDFPMSIAHLGRESFAECNSLEQIVMPNTVIFMESAVFRGCKNLKNVVLSELIKEIPSSTFLDCYSLEQIKINSDIRKIGHCAFAYCNNLERVNIPTGVEVLGNYVFSNCSSLERVKIPKTIRKMGIGTFENCKNLEYVIAPKRLMHFIEKHCIENCDNVNLITLEEIEKSKRKRIKLNGGTREYSKMYNYEMPTEKEVTLWSNNFEEEKEQ